MNAPGFLKGYEATYADDPRRATLEWFQDARFGLFLHYGLYSLLGRGEWAQYFDLIPVAEYERLKDDFRADKFDADFITDLALEAGMKYVNLTTKHCEGFCLWRTERTDFNSPDSPARRDLVAELADACERKGLGLFLFYEHGFDWRHPHGPAPWDWQRETVRPHYDPPDPAYATPDEYDLQKYVDFAADQIAELCSNHGPLAGVWLDGAAVPLSGDTSRFRLGELYALIRRLQPQALISYKWGVEGSEDYLAPEEHQVKLIRESDLAAGRTVRPMEVCTKLQRGKWGYQSDSEHIGADEMMDKIRSVAAKGANVLLNTGPLGDGSIHPEDVSTLREIGRRLRRDGWPTAAQ